MVDDNSGIIKVALFTITHDFKQILPFFTNETYANILFHFVGTCSQSAIMQDTEKVSCILKL